MEGKGTMRLMVDHATQIEVLDRYTAGRGRKGKWSVFVKVDGGGKCVYPLPGLVVSDTDTSKTCGLSARQSTDEGFDFCLAAIHIGRHSRFLFPYVSRRAV